MATRTFLFVDQVGSTEQLTRLGDAAAQQVRRGLFDLLRQATEAGGGHEVDFTGDGLFCAFEGAAEGVDAAVAMQQLAWTFNGRQPADRRLSIRVGLHTGEPLESEGGGYFGVAVVVASRLCAAATAGQILASDVVRSLVAPRGTHTFTTVGDLPLKGVPEPVTTFGVGWEPDPRGAALPADLAAAAAAPLVGRSRELAAVDAALEATTDGGERRLVLVGGDSGTGVTRLLAEAARRGGAAGATVWFGAAAGPGQRLAAWAQAVTDWADRTGRAELRIAVGGRAGDLARLAPTVRDRLPGTAEPGTADAMAATFVVADALDETVARMSATEPVVIVLDRLDAADDDTLTVVRRLVESTRPARLLILAGYQTSTVGTSRVLSVLGDVSDVVELELHGLDDEEVATLVARTAGTEPSAAAVRAIARETEGNPFFVIRMATALRERDLTSRVAEAVERAEGLRTDLRLQREEITLSLRELDQLRSHDAAGPSSGRIEPDGTPPAPGVCPYRGLPAFRTEDAEVFHGREQLVAELVARLVSSRFLAVVGPSGSGKSSAVRAGLLPALAAGAVPGSEHWVPVVVTPGREPVKALETALAGLDEGERTVVLVVDQLEELWTAATAADRATFVDRLIAATTATGSGAQLVLLVTVRADYYGHLAEHAALADLAAESQVLVGPMRPGELRAAVERPAQVAGLVLEPGLAQAVVDDAGRQPGALPLVSTALLETWQRRRGRSLTLAGYAEAGGVRGAVAHLADTTFDALADDEREAARRLLLRLASPGDGADDVARPVPAEELPTDPVTRGVLDRFVEQRLLTRSAGTVQVAHEALLREWPRLRRWLEADREGRRLHHQIATAATDWQTAARDPGGLLRGTRLAAAEDWRGGNADRLSPAESAFLDASVEARTAELTTARRAARRLRLLAIGLAVLLVGAIGAGGYAAVQQRTASRRADQADARGLAAQAIALSSTSVDTALLLAVEGYRRDASLDTEGGLLSALNGARYLVGYRPALAGAIDTAVTADGRTVWTVDTKGRITGYDTRTWTRRGPTITATRPPAFLGVSADGKRLVYDSPDGAHVVDLTTGRHIGGALGSESIMPSALNPDGSTVLVHDRTTRQAIVFDVATGRRRAAVTIGAGVTTLGDLRRGHDEFVAATWSSEPLIRRFRLDGTPLAAEKTLTLESVDTVKESPDGRQLVVTAGRQAQLLDAEPLAPVGAPVIVSGGRAGEAAFSPGGRLVAISADDGSIIIADRSDASVLTTITGLQGPAWSEFLDDDRLLGLTLGASAEYDLRRITAIGRAITPSPLVIDVSTMPGGDRAMVLEDASLSVVDGSLHRTPISMTLPEGWTLDTVAVAPDGRTAAVHRYRLDADHMAAEAAVDVLELPSGRVRRTVPLNGTREDDRYQVRLEFSPDGTRLAVGLMSGRLAVLDVPGARVVLEPAPVDTQSWALRALAWTTDGTGIYAGGQDGTLRLVDPSTGAVRRELELTPSGTLMDADVVPGTTWLAVVSESGEVMFVDTTTSARVGTVLNAGATQLHAVAVTPDGARVAAVSRDGALRIWDRVSGRPIGPAIDAHNGGASALTFLGDGQLLSSGFEGSVVAWDTRPTEWVDHACALAGRNLTRAEWTRYLPERPYRATCSAFAEG